MTNNQFYETVYNAIGLPSDSGIEDMRLVTADRYDPDARVLVGLLFCYGALRKGVLESLREGFGDALITSSWQDYGSEGQKRVVVRVEF